MTPVPVHVGLVNNMPDGAIEATERQFRCLLEEAAEEIELRFSLFALPEVPRSDQARRRIASLYSSIDELWDTPLDGLIVTGTEPQAPNLEDEPYWGNLAKLVEWADDNTHSAIWSCLAAHAATQLLDGIRRRPLGNKLFGVFESANSSEHFLMAGVPARVATPHSRWNGVPEDALLQCGYRVLTRSEHAGVDTFVKQRRSLFVFFQSHPEYEASSLLLEYRRDVQRFQRGLRDSHPAKPHGCFDENGAPIERNPWRPAALGLYRNWLRYLSAQKAQRTQAVYAARVAVAGR